MADSIANNSGDTVQIAATPADSIEPNRPPLHNANQVDPKTPVQSDFKSLPPLPTTDSTFDLKTQLKEAEEALEEELSLHHQTRADLQKQQQESDTLRKRLLQTANELNQVMRQNQGSNQLTDDEIIQKARQLRYEINSFVIQYFDHEIKNLKIPQSSYEYFSKYVRGNKVHFETYMRSSTRPALIEAFLWLFLEKEVFGQFRWAPTEASKMMTGMCNFFAPLKSNESDTIPEAQRKFHTWRSHTSTLVVNTMELGGRNALVETVRFMKIEVSNVASALEPFSPSSWHDLQGSLVEIMSRGLMLDEDISKQVASFTWSMEAPKTLPCPFDPGRMELEPSRQMSNGLTVRLVTAPGLDKSGNSFGENFDVTNTLLKMQVSCESPAKETAGEGPRLGSGLISRILGTGRS